MSNCGGLRKHHHQVINTSNLDQKTHALLLLHVVVQERQRCRALRLLFESARKTASWKHKGQMEDELKMFNVRRDCVHVSTHFKKLPRPLLRELVGKL